MPVGVTELSRDIYGLHMLIFWVCVVDRRRRVRRDDLLDRHVPEVEGRGRRASSTTARTAEIVWTIIPVVILVGDGDAGGRAR